jgi:hypothetical protein
VGAINAFLDAHKYENAGTGAAEGGAQRGS